MAWTATANVQITRDEQLSFLDRLAARLPFCFVVTSGTRSPHEQARAMFAKLELGGCQELLDTYADDAFATQIPPLRRLYPRQAKIRSKCVSQRQVERSEPSDGSNCDQKRNCRGLAKELGEMGDGQDR